MSDFERGRALLEVTSDLGPDVLMPVALSSTEVISRPFEVRLTLVSTRADINPDEVLYHGMTVSLQHDGQPLRHFHGIVRSFAWDEHIGGRGLTRYQACLVPRLWFLSQTSDCRIFQNQSMADIIRTILKEQEMPAPDFKLQKPHPSREYITQYNETDLQFISRLMQEEGCFYFFDHTASDHSFVVADDNSAFRPLGGPMLRFDSTMAADDVLTSWHHPRQTAQGRVRLLDHDPSDPGKQLDQMHRTVLKTSGSSTRDVFHWPALSHDPDDISNRARFRLEAEEAGVSLVHGEGSNRGFAPGRTFVLAADPQSQKGGGTYALRAVEHNAQDDTVVGGGSGAEHKVSFTAFKSSVPWREPFATERPRMDGVHAALVIGPADTPIHTDKLGRVKIQFFWDHRNDAHPDQAIWARISYPWGGGGWGWQSTPRVGTEVAVAFLDGDPDRPMVMGGLYNGNDSPIFSEKQRTKSGIRTRSVPHGSASNFNEISFDDDAGNELVYLQAEKDMKTLVKNDQELTVNHCRIVRIKQDETITIGGKQSTEVTDARSAVIQSGNDSLRLAQGNLSIDVQMGKISISAMQSIVLKVGETSVKLDPSGVTINGMLLNFSAVGMMKLQSATMQANADAMVVVSAGLIKLN